MKRVHLLRVEGDAARYAPLVDAIRADGGRVGWLSLGPEDPLPPSLTAPAGLDVLRAVAVGRSFAIAVKPMRGPAVMRDLLREHFRGCRLVLVAGEIEAPLVSPDGEGWTVRAGTRLETHSTDQLVAATRKPRPWTGAATPSEA